MLCYRKNISRNMSTSKMFASKNSYLRNEQKPKHVRKSDKYIGNFLKILQRMWYEIWCDSIYVLCCTLCEFLDHFIQTMSILWMIWNSGMYKLLCTFLFDNARSIHQLKMFKLFRNEKLYNRNNLSIFSSSLVFWNCRVQQTYKTFIYVY